VRIYTIFGIGCLLVFTWACPIYAFEGTIETTLIEGGRQQTHTYLISTNRMRIVRNETDRLTTINLVSLDTGEITFVFPQNRTYRCQESANKASGMPSGFPEFPMPPGGLPPGIGPQTGMGRSSSPATPMSQIGPSNPNGFSAMPDTIAADMQMQPIQLPGNGFGSQPDGNKISEVVPPIGYPIALNPTNGPGGAEMKLPAEGMDISHEGEWPGEQPEKLRGRRKLEFTASGQTTNLLGYACSHYTLTQRGLTMDIWATDQLPPFYRWQQDSAPRHHGPEMLQESWAEQFRSKNLFPLSVVLKNRKGDLNILEFRVKSIKPKPLSDEQKMLFQPPSDFEKQEPLRH
jgi:hypothetical protein